MTSLDKIIFTEGDKSIEPHADKRRTLSPVFNGGLEGFKAEQVKLAEMRQEAILGGHYHPDYQELFNMHRGNAYFLLEEMDQNGGPTGRQVMYKVSPGTQLLIPQRVPHSAFVENGALLVGMTSKMYVGPEVNDIVPNWMRSRDQLEKDLPILVSRMNDKGYSSMKIE